MSAARREPGPEALAYGQALRKIFLRLRKSQREVAKLLAVDPSVLSRFLSGKPSKDSAADTVAAREHAEALIRLVRASGATVTDAEIAELNELRKAAQAASPSQQDRVLLLQEQLEGLELQLDAEEARTGTFRGQAQSLMEVNDRLQTRIDVLQQRVREEGRRAERERREGGRQRQQRRQAQWWVEQAELRAEQAEQWGDEAGARLGIAEQACAEAEERAEQAVWGADATVARLRAVEGQRAEAQARSEQAEYEAAKSSADLAAADRQLAAAADYARESDVRIGRQQEQLQALRREVAVLRHQVRELGGGGGLSVSPPVAHRAPQVSGTDTDDARLRRAVDAWVASRDEGVASVDSCVAREASQRPAVAAGSAGADQPVRTSLVGPPNPTPEDLLRDLGRAPRQQAQGGSQPHEVRGQVSSDRVTVHGPRFPTNEPERAEGIQAAGDRVSRFTPQVHTARTTQQPKPPLDLLAELTKTPPPPKDRKSRKRARRFGKMIATLLATQGAGFLFLLLHMILSSPGFPDNPKFTPWLPSFMILALLGLAFLSSKKATMLTAAVLIAFCSLTASFGKDALIIPTVSHSAHDLFKIAEKHAQKK